MSNHKAQEIPQAALKTVCDILSPYLTINPKELVKALSCEEAQVYDGRLADRLLTLKEVTVILGVTLRHLYNLRDRGMLSFVHIGGAVRIKESNLISLIDGEEK